MTDTKEKEEKLKPWTQAELLKHFDRDFFRYASFHSWYKWPTQPGTVVPVLGNVQEFYKEQNQGFDGTLIVKEGEIHWHFGDEEWYEAPVESLALLVSRTTFKYDSQTNLFAYGIPFLRGDLTLKEWIQDQESGDQRFNEWKKIKGTYAKFRAAAVVISDAILADPDKVLIPKLCCPKRFKHFLTKTPQP